MVVLMVVVALLVGGVVGVLAPRLAGVERQSRAEIPPAEAPPATPVPPPAPVPAAPPAGPDTSAAGLTFEEIERAFRVLNAEQREQALQSQETFTRLVRQEAARVSVLTAARAAGFDDDPNVAYLMQRRAEQLLVDLFLQRVTRGRVPADFPSEAQMREFYEKNPAQFTAEDRVPVWQVFLPIPPDAGPEALAALEARGKRIAADIRSGKLSFAEAAATHSAHPGSRFNGGNMGLLKVSDLVPDIADEILTLPEGKVSDPLRAGNGFHVVRRGAVVPSHLVPLDQVKEELRERLRRLAMARLRQAAVRQTGQSAPALSDTKIEEWRLRLRAAALKPAG